MKEISKKKRQVVRTGTKEKFEWKLNPCEKIIFPLEELQKRARTEPQEAPIFNSQVENKSSMKSQMEQRERISRKREWLTVSSPAENKISQDLKVHLDLVPWRSFIT